MSTIDTPVAALGPLLVTVDRVLHGAAGVDRRRRRRLGHGEVGERRDRRADDVADEREVLGDRARPVAERRRCCRRSCRPRAGRASRGTERDGVVGRERAPGGRRGARADADADGSRSRRRTRRCRRRWRRSSCRCSRRPGSAVTLIVPGHVRLVGGEHVGDHRVVGEVADRCW